MTITAKSTLCEQRHKGVKLSITRWMGGSAVAFFVIIIAINCRFYDAYSAEISGHEIRLRKTEQSAAVTVVELRAIRAQLDRIETQLVTRKVAATP